ncbi:MAG TPA: hypothetical protein VFA20_34710, partial [Myxococcaceae bacterium]|nr:hypothetical protein [Myxococcaceae bacterium]
MGVGSVGSQRAQMIGQGAMELARSAKAGGGEAAQATGFSTRDTFEAAKAAAGGAGGDAAGAGEAGGGGKAGKGGKKGGGGKAG